MSRRMIQVVLVAMAVGSTAIASRAEQTTTSQTKSFEIVAVEGNKLVVRLPEGTKELTVPDDFRFNINGQQKAVQELTPGMKGTATITTSTTAVPVTVTEVKNGRVVKAVGSSIIVQTDDGFKSFTQGDIDKRGVTIMRAGKPAQLSDFRENDRLSATIITSMPPKVLTKQEVQATLASARPPEASTASTANAAVPASSSARAASTPTAGTTGTPAAPHKTLPKTASSLPLLGLLSALSLALGVSLTIRRCYVP